MTIPGARAFDHEKLDVYRTALEFASSACDMVASLRRARSPLADQLERAAQSIVLNIAEGSGEFSRKEKVRFYRMALRSAAECASILDTGRRFAVVSEQEQAQGKALLTRVAAMLTRLAHRHQPR